MEQKYADWIKENYPTKDSAFCACATATAQMVSAFPELKRERGHVYLALSGERTHWWCVAPDSVIIDPTAHQWDEPILQYEPYVVDEELGEPIGKCMECGELCYEKVPGASSCCCCHECAAALNEDYNTTHSTRRKSLAELDAVFDDN